MKKNKIYLPNDGLYENERRVIRSLEVKEEEG